jgi:hypothetical protein
VSKPPGYGEGHTTLSDPNAEYTMRELSAGTMGATAKRGGGRDIEITDVQTTMVDGNYPWTLVRVYTSAGISGTGEAYWGAGVPEIVERMLPFVVGENPLDLDRLFEHLVQKMSGEGSIEGTMISAISGIEIALHDLAGKILEVPAYQLVGGKYRDRVRVYCDCHAGDESEPESNAEEAERVVSELGYDALKFDLDVPSGYEKDYANRHLRDPEIRHKAEIVRAVTERVGDEADAAFDCHWTFSSGERKAAGTGDRRSGRVVARRPGAAGEPRRSAGSHPAYDDADRRRRERLPETRPSPPLGRTGRRHRRTGPTEGRRYARDPEDRRYGRYLLRPSCDAQRLLAGGDDGRRTRRDGDS